MAVLTWTVAAGEGFQEENPIGQNNEKLLSEVTAISKKNYIATSNLYQNMKIFQRK